MTHPLLQAATSTASVSTPSRRVLPPTVARRSLQSSRCSPVGQILILDFHVM
ncbi:hypothetical protein AHAS_Ahas05G0065300 [Arachis hypogaea]